MDAKNAPAAGTDPQGLSPESVGIFGTIFDFFGVLDKEGRVLSLSGKIFEGTNTNPDLLTNQVFPETVFWQSSELTPKLLAKAISNAAGGENARLILDFRVSADEKIAMDVVIQPLPPGDSLFICGQAVSEREVQVGRAKGASEQLLFAAENAAIGLWFWDFAENRIYATSRCNELFGLPAYETFRYESYREAIHPEDRDFVDSFLSASRDEGSKYEEEFRVLYPDGSIEWISAEGRSFLDENGEPQRMTGVVQKITEQKLAAAEISKIHEREKKAREEAVEANRAKDRFLAFLSHELRGQLNNIIGWLPILPTVDEDKRRSVLETMERNAKSLKKLLDDLVDSARVESGKVRLEYRTTNLYDIVRNSCQAHIPSAHEKNIQLEFTSDEKNIPLFADSSRLLQVFGNLLSNAIKFTPDGGRVSVEIETAEESVRVHVTDTGCGIDSIALPHIFEQFSQGAVAQAKSNAGLGLGLSFVKILVTKHGGVVHAESEGVDKGSRFTVTLPLTDTPIADEAETTARPVKGKPLAGSSVYIVEDDPDSREVLELFLAQNGARVKSFESVRSALAGFGSNGLPNVVISDLGMPDEDGYSLIQKIRGLPPETGGDIPAIALSAFTSEESRQKALELGFNKYCTKPFEHDQLIKDLMDLLGPDRSDN